jgi:hypothetical protein
MKTKICSCCEIEKPLTEFYKNKSQKDGYKYKCKICEKEYNFKNSNKIGEYNKQYWLENKDKLTYSNREYYDKNKEKILKTNKKYRENVLDINKEKERLKYYRENNKEKISEQQKIWRENNKQKTLSYAKEYRVNNKNKINNDFKYKYDNNPLFKLTVNIRNSIRNSFKNNKLTKKNKTQEILGCSFEEFRQHIGTLLEPWMTWENHGLYNGELNYGWDLDHIIPLASAMTENDIIRLNHFTNFQPLCSKINRNIKKDKII